MEELLGTWLDTNAPRVFRSWDRRFQVPLRRAIPDLDLLILDPVSRLGQPVRIGPKLRMGTGLIMGLFIAPLIGFTAAEGLYEEEVIDGTARFLMVFLIVTCLITMIIAVGLAIWLTDGSLIMRVDGVEFRYRKESVTCPWDLFCSNEEPIWYRADNRLVVPIDKKHIRRMIQANAEGSTRRGWDVYATQFAPWGYRGEPITDVPNRSWEILLADIYRCDPFEIVDLLRVIAFKVATPTHDDGANPESSH